MLASLIKRLNTSVDSFGTFFNELREFKLIPSHDFKKLFDINTAIDATFRQAMEKLKGVRE